MALISRCLFFRGANFRHEEIRFISRSLARNLSRNYVCVNSGAKSVVDIRMLLDLSSSFNDRLGTWMIEQYFSKWIVHVLYHFIFLPSSRSQSRLKIVTNSRSPNYILILQKEKKEKEKISIISRFIK